MHPNALQTPITYLKGVGPGRAAMLGRELGIDTYIGSDLLDVLNRFKPHIVHVHRAGWPEPELLKPIKRARTPVVVETNVFGRHDPSPQAAVIDATLFVSQFCLDRFAAATNIKAKPPRYGFLYNPVDTDFFAAHAAGVRRAVFLSSRAVYGGWPAGTIC